MNNTNLRSNDLNVNINLRQTVKILYSAKFTKGSKPSARPTENSKLSAKPTEILNQV